MGGYGKRRPQGATVALQRAPLDALDHATGRGPNIFDHGISAMAARCIASRGARSPRGSSVSMPSRRPLGRSDCPRNVRKLVRSIFTTNSEWERQSPRWGFPTDDRPGQLWLAAIGHRCGASSGGTGPLWSRMRAAPGSRVAAAKNRPHVEPSSKQQSWARQIRAMGVRAEFRKTTAQKAHARAASALRPMPVTMPRPVSSRPVRSGARPGTHRPRCSRDLGIFDRGTLPIFRRPASPWCSRHPLISCAPPSNLVQIRTIEFLLITRSRRSRARSRSGSGPEWRGPWPPGNIIG